MTANLCVQRLKGSRHEIALGEANYPAALRTVDHPPRCLYLIGDPWVLQEGLAVVGARKATPYGLSCAGRFAGAAASRGIVIISGGARGCDAAAHEAALDVDGKTVAFLGGGCDMPYPAENIALFQRIIDAGGAVVSEQTWDFKPLPFTFRERNRLIAGLARATLIVEAGLPSGTFSTADAALSANRDVLVVPGAITSPHSRGANRLIYQGAVPIVDDETFSDQLSAIFPIERAGRANGGSGSNDRGVSFCGTPSLFAEETYFADGGAALLEALQAAPLGIEELHMLAKQQSTTATGDSLTALMLWLATKQRDGVICQYPDGRYGARVRTH